MVAYLQDANAILVQPFQSKHDHHRIPAYTNIMMRLKARGLNVTRHVLDNEASMAYRNAITSTWNCTYQLVPPDMHRPAMQPNAPSAHLRHTSSLSWPASTPPSRPPDGTSSCPMRSSQSTSFARPARTQLHRPGSALMDHSTSMLLPWAPRAVARSSMQSHRHAYRGTTAARRDSTLDQPSTTTVVTPSSRKRARLSSSPTPSASGTPPLQQPTRRQRTASCTPFAP